MICLFVSLSYYIHFSLFLYIDLDVLGYLRIFQLSPNRFNYVEGSRPFSSILMQDGYISNPSPSSNPFVRNNSQQAFNLISLLPTWNPAANNNSNFQVREVAPSSSLFPYNSSFYYPRHSLDMEELHLGLLLQYRDIITATVTAIIRWPIQLYQSQIPI